VGDAVLVEVRRPAGEFRAAGHAEPHMAHRGYVRRALQKDRHGDPGQGQHGGEAHPVLAVVVVGGAVARPEDGLEPGDGLVEIGHGQGHVMQPCQRRRCHRCSRERGVSLRWRADGQRWVT
jgi:hypothetical protein